MITDAPEGSMKIEDLDYTPDEQVYINAKKKQIHALIETDTKFKAHLGINLMPIGSMELSEKHLKDDTSERMVDLNRLDKLAKANGGKLSFTLRNEAGEELDLTALYLQ